MEKRLVTIYEKTNDHIKFKVRIWVQCEYCYEQYDYECVCEGTRFLEDITYIIDEKCKKNRKLTCLCTESEIFPK